MTVRKIENTYLVELDNKEKPLFDFFGVLAVGLDPIRKTHDVAGYACDLAEEELAECFGMQTHKTLVLRPKED